MEETYKSKYKGEEVDSLLDLVNDRSFLSKLSEDETNYLIKFLGGLQVGEFLKGAKGIGMYQDIHGNWHIETDYLDVRFKFTATEVEIQHTSHIGGKLINSAANMVVSEVVENGNSYICYMNTVDDAGNEIYNKWKVGDQAFCETFNLVKQADGKVGNHFLWRLVTGIGENYIILSKDDCAVSSDAPMVGDELVLLGNRIDHERQGAIVMASAGSGSPYIRIFRSIKSYSLPKPVINLAPEGTEIKADSIVLQSTGGTMEDEANSLINITTVLSRSLYGSFQVWQGDAIPTLENEPAMNWSTSEAKQEHLGDFYITPQGFCYQFAYHDLSATYYWKIITDRSLINYVEQIEEKRRVFVNEPTENDVYDIGDTWVNATYPEDGSTYSNDVLVCIQAKDKGDVFSIDHWQKNSKYTDDTVANLIKKELEDFQETYAETVGIIQDQLDGKAETWYQDTDPSEDWETPSEHVGDLWYKESTGETFYFDGTQWKEQNIPTAVFDKFDAKASIYVSKPSNYKKNDMWILEAGYTLSGVAYPQGTIVFSIQDSTEFNVNHWMKHDRYTDDSALNKFLISYAEQINEIKSQIDEKSETWYQSEDPSLEWTTTELKELHVGDLWYNTNTSKSYTWSGSDWAESDVPQEVFDKIDGKAAIYVSLPTTYNVNDLWFYEGGISDVAYDAGTILVALMSRTNNFVATDWTKKDKYTDDSSLNNFIDKTYIPFRDSITKQLDKKAETWYQDADPRTSPNWGSDEERIGDMWCNTAGKTQIWNGVEWMQQGVPDDVFDKIDGKSSIFVGKPENGYQKRDLWILEKDYVLDKSKPYKTGTIVVATRDMEIAFSGTDWTKLDSYSDQEEVDNIKDDLQSLANKVNSEFAGSFYIWQGDDNTVPTLNNKPAVDWTDDNMLQAHVDDFYITADGVVYQFRLNGSTFGWVKVDDKYIIAYIEQMRSQLLNTGIDIEKNVITVTAGQFKVQDRKGNPIAIFEVDTTTGLPTIKGEYLHVNYVNIADKKILLNPDGSGQLAGGKLSWDKDNKMVFTGDAEAAEAGIGKFIEITEDGFKVYQNFPTSSPSVNAETEINNDSITIESQSVGKTTMNFSGVSVSNGTKGSSMGLNSIGLTGGYKFGMYYDDNGNQHFYCEGSEGLTGMYSIGDKLVTLRGGIIVKIEKLPS